MPVGKAKGHAPKYTNATAYEPKRNVKLKNKERDARATVESRASNGVCRRCRDKVAYKFKFDKYKPLRAPGKCAACRMPRITLPCRTLCDMCAAVKVAKDATPGDEKGACPGCTKPWTQINAEEAASEGGGEGGRASQSGAEGGAPTRPSEPTVASSSGAPTKAAAAGKSPAAKAEPKPLEAEEMDDGNADDSETEDDAAEDDGDGPSDDSEGDEGSEGTDELQRLAAALSGESLAAAPDATLPPPLPHSPETVAPIPPEAPAAGRAPGTAV